MHTFMYLYIQTAGSTFILPSKTRYTSFEYFLRTELCHSGIYSPGTYSGSLPPSSRDIGNPISRRLVDTSPRPPSITLPPVSVIKHTEYGWPQIKQSQIRTRTSSRYPVSGALVRLGSEESFPPSIQSSGDNGTRMPNNTH